MTKTTTLVLAVAMMGFGCASEVAPSSAVSAPTVRADKPEQVSLTSTAPSAAQESLALSLGDAGTPPLEEAPRVTQDQSEHRQQDQEPIRQHAVEVSEVIVAPDRAGRRPVGATDTFSKSSSPRVYVFVKARNTAGEPERLRVRLNRGGATVAAMRLEVPAYRRWTTFGRFWLNSREPGAYTITVHTEDGTEVGTKSFTVTD